MKTCNTCKFWGTGQWGTCGEVDSYRVCNHHKCDPDVFNPPKDGFGVFDGGPYSGGTFCAGPKFGCVHHEEKE